MVVISTQLLIFFSDGAHLTHKMHPHLDQLHLSEIVTIASEFCDLEFATEK